MQRPTLSDDLAEEPLVPPGGRHLSRALRGDIDMNQNPIDVPKTGDGPRPAQGGRPLKVLDRADPVPLKPNCSEGRPSSRPSSLSGKGVTSCISGRTA